MYKIMKLKVTMQESSFISQECLDEAHFENLRSILEGLNEEQFIDLLASTTVGRNIANISDELRSNNLEEQRAKNEALAEIGRLEDEIGRLEAELRLAQLRRKNAEDDRSDIEHIFEQNKQELAQVVRANLALERELVIAQEKVDAVDMSLSERDQNIAALNVVVGNLRASLGALQKQWQDAVTKIQKLEKTLNWLNAANLESERIYQGIVVQLAQEKERSKYLEQAKGVVEQEVAGLRKENAQLETDNARLYEEPLSVNSLLTNTHTTTVSLEQELEQVNQDSPETEVGNADASSVEQVVSAASSPEAAPVYAKNLAEQLIESEKVRDLKRQTEQLEARVAALVSENSKLEAQVGQLETEKEVIAVANLLEIEESNKNMRKTICMLEKSRLDSYRAQQKTAEELSAARTSLESVSGERNTLRSKKEKLGQELSQANAKLSQANAGLSQANADVEALRGENYILWSLLEDARISGAPMQREIEQANHDESSHDGSGDIVRSLDAICPETRSVLEQVMAIGPWVMQNSAGVQGHHLAMFSLVPLALGLALFPYKPLVAFAAGACFHLGMGWSELCRERSEQQLHDELLFGNSDNQALYLLVAGIQAVGVAHFVGGIDVVVLAQSVMPFAKFTVELTGTVIGPGILKVAEAVATAAVGV
jgi:DNA repair exonuclease SbcCD ATPase subunit